MPESLLAVEQKPWYQQRWFLLVGLSSLIVGPFLVGAISYLAVGTTNGLLGKSGTLWVGLAPSLLLGMSALIMILCDTRWHRYQSPIVAGSFSQDVMSFELKNGDWLYMKPDYLEYERLISQPHLADYERRFRFPKEENRNITFSRLVAPQSS